VILAGEVAGIVRELDAVDRAVYEAIAAVPTPRLDAAMRTVSRAADHSKLSMAVAGILAAGGSRGRRAAACGLASVAVTSAVVNVGLKPVGRRRRPDRLGAAVPEARHVPMPSSRSFPSGHSASAMAFAAGVSRCLPWAAAPLYGLAAVVSYSRVHTGVHFPGDVIGGAVIGLVVGNAVAERLGA
jgi:undecaprenyl-diphosphatase